MFNFRIFNKAIKQGNVARSLYAFDKDTGFWGGRNIQSSVQTDLRVAPVNIYHNEDGLREDSIASVDNNCEE